MRFLIKTFGVFLLLVSNVVLSQHHHFSGQVFNEQEQFISNAHIHFGEYTTVSNPIGEFEFRYLYAKKYRLVITHVGYQTLDTLIDLRNDLKSKWILKPTTLDLENVLVQQKLTIHIDAPSTFKRNHQEILSLSHLTFGNVIRGIPGVNSLKTGSNLVKPMIQGLHSSRVILINQNIKQEDQSWGLEHAPALESHQFGSIERVQGVATLRFSGESVGGMLMAVPKKVIWKDTLQGYFKSSGFSNGRGSAHVLGIQKATHEGWFGTFSATFKHRGDLKSADYYLKNTGSREIHASSQLGYRKSNWGIVAHYSFYDVVMGILRASHIGNVTDLLQAINQGIPQYTGNFSNQINAPRQEVTHHQSQVSFYQKWEDFGKMTLDYGFQWNQRYEFDIRRGNLIQRPAVDMRLLTHSLNGHFESLPKNHFRWEAGFNMAYQNNDSNTQNTGVRALIPNYQKLASALYFNVYHEFTEQCQFEAGVRWDYVHLSAIQYYLKTRWDSMNYQQDFSGFITDDFGTQWRTAPKFDFQGFSGVFGNQWRLNPKQLLTVYLQSTNRNPNPSELFSDGLHHGTGQIERGDMRLKQERGLKFHGEWRYECSKTMISFQPFLQQVQNFAILNPTGTETTIRGAFPVWQYQQVKAQLAGLDMIWNQKWSDNLEWNQQFSWIYGQNLNQDKALIDLPPVSWRQNIIWRKPNWRFFEIALTTETVFTQKRYPNNDFETLVPQNGDLIPTWVQISQPPEGYQLWHLNIQNTWKSDFIGIKKGSVKTGVLIDNLWNTRYRDYLNRMRFFADDLGRNLLVYVQINF